MNWNRIWTGSVAAGAVVFAADMAVNEWILANAWSVLQAQGYVKTTPGFALPLLVLRGLLIGFALSWLYALVRSRFGPGPKTALLVATLVGALAFVPTFLNQWLWMPAPASFAVWNLLSGLVACWVGGCVAGWQYMEKAP